MPLFGSKRDGELMLRYNREMIQNIISIEVEIFKISTNDTATNIYNESDRKVYYNPIRFYCLIRKDDKTTLDSDIGIDFTKTIQFNFIRKDLLDKGFRIIEGDVIKFDSQYFQVDNVRESQYWVGRNNETLISNQTNNEHGMNVSTLVDAHLTKLTSLNLVDTFHGTIPKPTKKHDYL